MTITLDCKSWTKIMRSWVQIQPKSVYFQNGHIWVDSTLSECTFYLLGLSFRSNANRSCMLCHPCDTHESPLCHPSVILLSFLCHPSVITVSSQCHPCVIPVSSLCHPSVIHLSSQCHPLSSLCHPCVIPVSSLCHPYAVIFVHPLRGVKTPPPSLETTHPN